MRAIISAAGWKGAGTAFGLPQVPEPFLPLGDGTTPLSRTATMLRKNGHEVYIAVGQEGYPYNRYIRWSARASIPLPKFPPEFPWSWSPWTEERLCYAERFGKVLQMTDPGGWTTSLDTFCEAMDQIGEDAWDGLFLACGDTLTTRACFEFVLGLDRPHVFSFTAYHNYYGLDLDGARFFREYAEDFRRFKDERAWAKDKEWAPGHLGTQKLREAGFTVHSHDIAPEHEWVDVDYEGTYRTARKWIERGIGSE